MVVQAAIITVLPGSGTSSENGRAPQGSRLFINSTYIITPAEMTASGFGADLVTSIGWNYTATTNAPTGQNISTSGNLKVYLQTTSDVTYTKGTVFSTVGMTKIIDAVITLPVGVPFTIDVPTGGPGTLPFNTVAGSGVYVAFEYQTTSTLATFPAPGMVCTSVLASSVGTYQSQTANGTAMGLSAFRAETRFGNSQVDLAAVTDVYALGSTAIPFGNPQPLSARVANVSGAFQSFNVDFEVREKATNTLRFSQSVPVGLLANTSLLVTATGWNPTLTELDTVIVSIPPLPTENALANNSKGYRHNVTPNLMAYATNLPASGSVGYNTGSGLLVNRYELSGCTRVDAVQVWLVDVNSIGNTVYAVVLNSAGTVVATSSNLVVGAGNINGYHTFTINTPPTFTNETVYIGLAQTATIGLGYFPMGTQAEPSPTRPNAFYGNIPLVGGPPVNFTTLGRWMLNAVLTPLSTAPTASGGGTICENASTLLSVSGGSLSATGTWQWYSGTCGGTPVGSGASINVSPGLGTTDYFVRSEDVCNATTSTCAQVSVNVLPNFTWHPDVDGDGFGDPNFPVVNCVAPPGHVLDNTDLCPTDPNKIAPGLCGCGVSDTDSDSDGTPDCNDGCPLDPNKSAPGVCGCGNPEPGTACNDGNPSTINDVITPACICLGTPPAICTQNEVTLTLETDNKAIETSWEIVPGGGGASLCSGSGYPDNSTVTEFCCLPNGCYDLRVLDSFGDGMCCAFGTGGYVLRNNQGRRIIDNDNDGAFTNVSQVANSFCVPIGTDGLVASSCDVETLTSSSVVQAQSNVAVTSAFNTTPGNSGYQFWFFNPDGGYSRRVLQTHSAPGAAWPPATAPALRASYLRIGDVTTNPIPSQVLLNIRVRALVSGVFYEFGSACRAKVDPVANCAPTQLTTTANPAVSCGATNINITTAGAQGSFVYADAITMANRYQFEFTRSGQTRRIASNTTSVSVGGLATNPLVCGESYDVRVRASFDFGITYCAFGPVCTITTAPCVPGAGGRLTDATENTDLILYPNPNRGDQLTVLLTGIGEQEQQVQLDLIDVHGRVVLTRTYVTGEALNTLVDLGGGMASGLYTVNATIGTQRWSQRLVVQ
ncbi:MAG: T9SS type A sorting domain-containing protein [Flavobacteriales bacterium]|nr:T9SS type A sorting domain-containing protein [Flavobacteriales bacterium]